MCEHKLIYLGGLHYGGGTHLKPSFKQIVYGIGTLKALLAFASWTFHNQIS